MWSNSRKQQGILGGQASMLTHHRSYAGSAQRHTFAFPNTTSKNPTPQRMSPAYNGAFRPASNTASSSQPIRAFQTSPGLVNMGNSCYLNSILQVLIHSDDFYSAITTTPHKPTCRKPQPPCLLCYLEDFVKKARAQSLQVHGQPMQPHMFVQNLRRISQQLTPGYQEDAAEFLRLFRDHLQACCGPQPKEKPPIERPYPFSLFAGAFTSIVKCLECKTMSRADDPIEDLVLEIQQPDMQFDSVEASLKHHCATETLQGSNKYRCDKCATLTVAHKRFLIKEVPKLLSIQLKRFNYMGSFGSKVGRHIRFSMRMSLNDYVVASVKKRFDVLAKLFGVVVHQGASINSGHYYAYVLGGDGHWYKKNDSYVTRTDCQTVLNDKAYMLFYAVELKPKEGVKDVLPRACAPEARGREPASTSTPETPVRRVGLLNGASFVDNSVRTDFIGPQLPPDLGVKGCERAPPDPPVTPRGSDSDVRGFIGPELPPSGVAAMEHEDTSPPPPPPPPPAPPNGVKHVKGSRWGKGLMSPGRATDGQGTAGAGGVLGKRTNGEREEEQDQPGPSAQKKPAFRREDAEMLTEKARSLPFFTELTQKVVRVAQDVAKDAGGGETKSVQHFYDALSSYATLSGSDLARLIAKLESEWK